MSRVWNILEVIELIDAVKDANLTPHQAVKAVYTYQKNTPTRKVSRVTVNGRAKEYLIHGNEKRYSNK